MKKNVLLNMMRKKGVCFLINLRLESLPNNGSIDSKTVKHTV